MRSSNHVSNIIFLTVADLGWKTWAAQLERYDRAASDKARHRRITIPKWLRYLSRPLPWPIRRALYSERDFFRNAVNRELAVSPSTLAGSIVVASAQQLVPHLFEYRKKYGFKLAVCFDTTGPSYTRDLLHQSRPLSCWSEERSVYESADLLVPWSNWARDSLINDFEIDPRKILLTPPAVGIEEFRTPKKHESHTLPRILFVGNDWKRKGGNRLVQWHQSTLADRAELHIVSAKAPRIHGRNVINHGVVPRPKLLSELLPTVDIFCMPTFHDMSPFAIAEAQAAGLPVISSALAGIPDLVRHGESGFLCPPSDNDGFLRALTRLVEDAALRDRMSLAARKHASDFLDAAVVFPRLMSRLEELLSNSSHPSKNEVAVRTVAS